MDASPLRLSDYRPRSQLRVPVRERERAALPCVDAHNHLGRWLSTDGAWMCPDVPALIDVMDQNGVEAIVNLDGRWGVELEENLDRYDRSHPGRFATFCHINWEDLAEGGTIADLERELRASAAAGARGIKVWKNLGLGLEDAGGTLLVPDDPRFGSLWSAAGELGLPVLIHLADPIAFFEPVDRFNERYEELLLHPDWSFADSRFPRFWRLMEALEAVVRRHADTVFIGAHAGCCAEDLRWVARMLDSCPNFHIDLSARVAELGRQPRATRALIGAYPLRVLFGTDVFPVSTEAYRIYFRFLETADEHFAYHPDPDDVPPQGRWMISGIDLPPDVLEFLYRENARRVIGI